MKQHLMIISVDDQVRFEEELSKLSPTHVRYEVTTSLLYAALSLSDEEVMLMKLKFNILYHVQQSVIRPPGSEENLA